MIHRTAPAAIGALALGALLTQGCVPENERPVTFRGKTMSAVEATWLRGTAILPPRAWEGETSETYSTPGTDLTRDIIDAFAARGERMPVIVFLHGCRGGWSATHRIGMRYAKEGFLVVAPDSTKRPNWRLLCGRTGASNTIWQRQREAEIRHAMERLSALAGIDHSRIYLMGFSQGAGAVALHGSAFFRGKIMLGQPCSWSGGRARGPKTQPMLAMLSREDPLFSNKPSFERCKVNDHPDSASLWIDGITHDLTHVEPAMRIVDRFLERTL